jgi:predicted MFS family arabinose efflux permease
VFGFCALRRSDCELERHLGHCGVVATTSEPVDPRRWYVLGLLTLVYALSIADRFVMSTLIEPIKAALRLSDFSIAFLTGTALACFYVTAGLPLAYLADRANRRSLVAAALAAWSVMTACCGIVQTYGQMLLARIGVGVGEAGGTPPSVSLLSDYFPWRTRALAMSIYSLGLSLGSALGTSAGYVSDAWGWRAAFLVLGVPGLVVALAVRMTIAEPARGRLDEGPPPAKASFADVWNFARGQPALVHAWMGAAVYTLWAWGLMWWTPSYLVRSHHMSLGAAGGALSLMNGIGGTGVLLLTLVLMGKLERKDVRAVPLYAAAAVLIGTFPSILAYAAESRQVTLLCLWIFIPLSYAPFGPTFALVQNLTPASMRAQSTAIMLFLANIANLVIAPQLVGFASDRLAPLYGAESLRWCLVPLAFVGFWGAWHFWRCAKYTAAGLERTGNATLPQTDSAGVY